MQTILTFAAIVTANGLCAREMVRHHRFMNDQADRQTAQANARRQAQLRADRLAAATPTTRPAGICRY